MAFNLSLVGGVAAQFFDNSGNVLTGGKIYTYLAGTTTPVATYTTSVGNVPWSNPIILNSAGRVSGSGEIWVSSNISYKFILKDSNDVLIATYDNINNITAANISYTAPYLTAVQTTVADKLAESVSVKDFGAVGDGSTDDTIAITNAIAASNSVYFPQGTYKITSEIELRSDMYIYGAGQNVSILNFYKASNPASSEFMLAARYESNILIENMTVKSNAYADGLFNVGTYYAGPPKRYVNGDLGNINGILISSCSNITIQNCEITGFNYDGIRVTVEGDDPNTDYNYNLKFDKLYGHHCLVTPLDILGTIGYSVTNCTMTDNGNYTAQYIDGSTGYGIVMGRTANSNQLPARSGICANNYCARNVRHGIDAHSAVDLLITDNICEDNLAMGVGVLDYSGSADDTTGDVVVQNNLIKHTVWVVSQYPLLTYRDDGTERDDSLGIYVSGFSNLIVSAVVQNNNIKDLRYKQLVANTGTDVVGAIFCSGTSLAAVRNNNVEAYQTNYYPSIMLDAAAPRLEITGNHFRGYQRSTISKEYFRFNASGGAGVANISGNYFEAVGTYSDSAGTQAAYPLFRKIAGDLMFTGNTVVQTSQGVRGPLWYSVYTNQQWGFNGILAQNSGNTLKVGGTTTMEYANEIEGSLEIYISSTGAGRYDGFSSGSAFVCTSSGTFQQILGDMPKCKSGLTVHIIDQISFGATDGATIPVWQDNITFTGDSADNTNSMTKTAGISHTGGTSYMISCPERATNITFQYLYLGSNAIGSVCLRPQKVLYCGVECTNAGAYGVNFEFRQGYVYKTRVKGGTAGIYAGLASSVVSQINDSDATQPLYGLYANSAAIYKNSTQPTGSTANELMQNGGTIA